LASIAGIQHWVSVPQHSDLARLAFARLELGRSNMQRNFSGKSFNCRHPRNCWDKVR